MKVREVKTRAHSSVRAARYRVVAGTTALLVWEFVPDKPHGWDSVIVALPLSVLALVVGSLLTKPPAADEAVTAVEAGASDPAAQTDQATTSIKKRPMTTPDHAEEDGQPAAVLLEHAQVLDPDTRERAENCRVLSRANSSRRSAAPR